MGKVENITNLTGLRFFLALWVILFHLQSIDIPIANDIVKKGYLGVDFFFILSGYILTHVYKRNFINNRLSFYQYVMFIKKRFLKIYPVHLLTFLASFIFLWLLYKFVSPTYKLDYDLVIPTISLTHAWGITDALGWNYPSWSISAEWFAYIFIFPLAGILVYRFNKLFILIIAAVFWIILIIYSELYNTGIGLTYNALLRVVPEFLIGVVLYLYYDEYKHVLIKCKNILLTINILLVISIYILFPATFDYFIIIPACLLLISLSIGGRISNKIFSNKLIQNLGTISYSIYMTQFFAKIIAGIICRNLESGSNFLFVSIAVLLTITFGYASYYLIERPFANISFNAKLKEKRDALTISEQLA